MIYWKTELIEQANKIINGKQTSDDIKAHLDLYKIIQTLQEYYQTGQYDSNYVKELDEQIRRDYPIIAKIYSLPSNGNTRDNSNNTKGLPYEINALDVDCYGILISVLLKKSIVQKLEDVIDNIQ